MKPSSTGVVLSTVGKAERLLAAASITLECDTPMQLSTSPFHQIDIAWAFELILGGVVAFNVTFISYLDKWFVSCFQDTSNSSLFHSTRFVEENYYCIVMHDWKATAKVPQDNKTFTSHFSPNLTPPHLLYQVNIDLSFNQHNMAAMVILSAGMDIVKDMEVMHKKMD
jgi:hypothetical protein